MNISDEYYKTVSANTTDTKVVGTPDNGVSVYIYKMGGNAARSTNVQVGIMFGDDIIWCTHGDHERTVPVHLTGDGSKQLKLILRNDSSIAETIGAYLQVSCGC